MTTTETPKRKRGALPADPAKAAVAIAKDVLKHMETGKLRAAHGDYFEAGDDNSHETLEARPAKAPLQALLKKRGFNCEVCAIGGLFASAVYRANEASVADAYSARIMREKLAPYFSADQLALIECAFERAGSWSWVPDGSSTHQVSGVSDAIRFGDRYKTDAGRMRAIMRNIIENRGVFVPPQTKATL